MRTYEGPLTVKFYISGKEVTQEEVVKFLKEQYARKERKAHNGPTSNLQKS